MKTTAIGGLITAFACLAFCFFAPLTAAETDLRLAKVIQDWARRQAKFDSIRYVISGETTYLKGSATDELGRPLTPPKPSRDFFGKVNWKVAFDFASHRHRWEVEDEEFLYKQEQLRLVVRLKTCDGKVAQNSSPRLPGTEKDDAPPNYSNLDMSIVGGNLSLVLFEAGSLPLFHGHGIVPTTQNKIFAGHLRRDIRPEHFHVQGTGVHEGHPCLVLRTEAIGDSRSFHEFWVDVARQAAILRYAFFSGDQVEENYDVLYKESPEGWMPFSWSQTVFLRQKPHTIKKFQVVSREVSPLLHDQDFRQEVLPWMRVRQIEYGEPANPLVMPPTVEDRMLGPPGWAEKGRWGRLLLLLALAAVVVGILLLAKKAAQKKLRRT